MNSTAPTWQCPWDVGHVEFTTPDRPPASTIKLTMVRELGGHTVCIAVTRGNTIASAWSDFARAR